jgi:hypothetical protein
VARILRQSTLGDQASPLLSGIEDCMADVDPILSHRRASEFADQHMWSVLIHEKNISELGRFIKQHSLAYVHFVCTRKFKLHAHLLFEHTHMLTVPAY